MPVVTETATVYRGGRRRWFSLEAACNAEAWVIMRAKDKPRCECDRPEYGGGFLTYPGYTCDLHKDGSYQKRHRRLVRLVRAAFAASVGAHGEGK